MYNLAYLCSGSARRPWMCPYCLVGQSGRLRVMSWDDRPYVPVVSECRKVRAVAGDNQAVLGSSGGRHCKSWPLVVPSALNGDEIRATSSYMLTKWSAGLPALSRILTWSKGPRCKMKVEIPGFCPAFGFLVSAREELVLFSRNCFLGTWYNFMKLFILISRMGKIWAIWEILVMSEYRSDIMAQILESADLGIFLFWIVLLFPPFIGQFSEPC